MIAAGQTITVRVNPRRSVCIAGQTATVVSVRPERVMGRDLLFASIQLPDGDVVQDIPVDYLTPAHVAKRRSPLTLKPDADPRSEAQRQADGVDWLRRLGYRVVETDTHRGKAVCGKCSREQGRKVYVHCGCGAPGFSPTTGADAGVADTEVQHPRWPGHPTVSLNIEWKKAENSERRPAQAEREAAGEIVVVWDLATLACAIAAFEESLGVDLLPGVAEIVRKAKAAA